MASFIVTVFVFLAVSVMSAYGSDPELTTDFFVAPGVNVSSIDSSYFKFTGLEGGVVPPPGDGHFGATRVFSNVFTALTGLGISTALFQYSPGGLNPPHTHPRGSELLYVITGTLNVGLIDTTNKLYEQNLTAGDLFIFPKGLVHYQKNLAWETNTTALATFSSSSPGTVSLPSTLFGSNIPVGVLTEAFAVNADIIGLLETPFGGV